MMKLAVTLGALSLFSSVAFAADPVKEEDLTWEVMTTFHKAVVLAGVNKLRRDNPACAEMDLTSVHYDADRGNPDNPAFTVQCGAADHLTTLHFTKADVESELSKQ